MDQGEEPNCSQGLYLEIFKWVNTESPLSGDKQPFSLLTSAPELVRTELINSYKAVLVVMEAAEKLRRKRIRFRA